MSQRQSHDLTRSFLAVERARSTLDSARAQGSQRGPATAEQRALWSALEDCAVVLDEQGHPMSYRMHNELTMYRALFRPPRRQDP